MRFLTYQATDEWIGGHYFHTLCPYVHTFVCLKNKNTPQRPANKLQAKTDTMRENNDHIHGWGLVGQL